MTTALEDLMEANARYTAKETALDSSKKLQRFLNAWTAYPRSKQPERWWHRRNAMRRYLNQYISAKQLAVGIDTYREQLIDITTDPGSDWMDTRCRRYSLRHLASYIVSHDRALRWARGCPTARLSCKPKVQL